MLENATPAIREYKISEEGLKEIKKQIAARTIPLMIIAIAGGITISTINSKDKISGSSGLMVLPIIIVFMAIVVGFSLRRAINRQRELYKSYLLTLTRNMISREQLNTPTIAIYLNEVKEIIKNKKGGFTIKGKNPVDLIMVPTQIENYAELEAALSQIRPIATKSSESIWQKYRIALTLLTVGLMFCVYGVMNKVIVTISGAILVAFLIYSLYETQRSKNVDEKTKRGSWVVLIVLISIIAVVIMKLTAPPKF